MTRRTLFASLAAAIAWVFGVRPWPKVTFTSGWSIVAVPSKAKGRYEMCTIVTGIREVDGRLQFQEKRCWCYIDESGLCFEVMRET